MLSSLFSIKRAAFVALIVLAFGIRAHAQIEPNQINFASGACTSLQYYSPFDNTCHDIASGGNPNGRVVTAGTTAACGEFIRDNASGTSTIALPSLSTGCTVGIQRGVSASVVTIDPGATAYDGVTTQLPQGQSVFIWTDGTGWHSTAPILVGSGMSYTAALTGNTFAATGGASGLPACPDTSGSGTAQSCSTSPTFTPTANQSCILYNTTTPNSGTGLTVNINSLGAKSVAIAGSSSFTTTLTSSIIPSGKPIAMCYDGTNWDVLQTGTAASGSTFTLPISTYNLGAGVCHITDSTGPGSGTFAGGTTAILWANYNSQGCAGYEYPGTWYTNGNPNTGNATTADIVGVELVANENPPNYQAKDYYIQGGVGDFTTCGTALGWGHFSDCAGSTTAGLVEGLLWAGTPQGGKLLATNAATTGTWTAYSPYTWNGTTGNASWTNGVGKCGTTGATMTFTTMPASGALWFSYVDVSGGTAGANVVVDGGSPIAVTNNVLGSWSTNHLTEIWYPQRFAISGTGQHTVVVTVTSGSFCPLYVVTPNPSSWDGMQLPNVYASIMPPQSGGYSGAGNDVTVKNAQIAAISQVQSDGLHVSAADLFNLTWPESAGNTQWCEYNNACTYPNGMTSTSSATPHYNNVGNTLNAWGFLQAAKRTPFKDSLVSDSGVTTNITQVGPNRKVTADGTNVDNLNRANTHSVGAQQINTGDIATVGQIVKGSLSSSSTPPTTNHSLATVTYNGGNLYCSWTNTIVVGDRLVVEDYPSVLGQSLGTPVGNKGETYTLIGQDSNTKLAMYFSSAATSGGTDTVTVNLSSGNSCQGGQLWNLSGSTLDGTPATNYGASGPTTLTLAGPTTGSANDLLLVGYKNFDCGTRASDSGYTSVDESASANLLYKVAGAAGSYATTLSTGISGGCRVAGIQAAFTGPGATQTADLAQYQDNTGAVLGAIDKVGKLRSTVYSSETVTFSAIPTFSTSTRYSEIVMTANITSFTLAAGSVGQEKTLCFIQDGTGSRTVAAPSNVHGFFTVGTTASKANCQHFIYSSNQSAWIADSAGMTNQ